MSTPARPATRPGFAETLTALERAQKPGHGVPAYTRWVNRRVARYFAAAAVAMGITPNGVTAISAVCSAAGILTLLLAPPTALTALAVALLFALGYGLDSADGQVARVTGASSPAGEWLDHVVDSIRVPLHPPCRLGRVHSLPPAFFPDRSCRWFPLRLEPMVAAHGVHRADRRAFHEPDPCRTAAEQP